VFTVRVPEFAHAQEGTLHFQHLVDSQGGLVRTASTLQEHVEQLAAVADGTSTGAANGDFVRRFLRPHGLDVEATGVFARAIEGLAQLPRPGRQGTAWWVAGLRPPAFVLARLARVLAEDRPLWAYAMQPFLSGAIRTWAAIFAAREASGEAVHRTVKRARRRVRRAWHESSREIGRRVRRTNKKVTAQIRSAGAAAKRVARRSFC
jgi:hypothetical protein